MLYVEADSSGADCWKLDPVVDLLKQGAVGVIPTDTVYVALLRFMSIVHQLSFLSIFNRVTFDGYWANYLSSEKIQRLCLFWTP